MPIVAPRLILAIPALILFIVVTAVVALLAPIPSPAVLSPVIGLVVALLAVWLLDRRSADAALRSLGARPLDPDVEPRLESLVQSICASHGISEPKLYLVDSRAPDAAVAGRVGDPRLVLTSGALRQLDRLELEAVVARELAQFGNGIHAATVLAAVSPLLGPFAAVLRSRLLDDRRLALTDIEGVRLTRYPPALASFFQKAEAGTGVKDNPASRHLWLVGPVGLSGSVQPPLNERIDTLLEL